MTTSAGGAGSEPARAAPSPLPPLVEEFLKWRVEVQDRSPRTVEADAADLKDFLRRTEIADVASVTVRDIDSYPTRMGLDKLERDTKRRRLYTLKSFYDWMHSRGHVQVHPMAEFRIPRRRTSETGAIFSEAEVQKIIYRFKPPTPSRQPREPAGDRSPRDRDASLESAEAPGRTAAAERQSGIGGLSSFSTAYGGAVF